MLERDLLLNLRGGTGLSYAAALHPRSGEFLTGGEVGHAWVPVGEPPTWIIPSDIKLRLSSFWDLEDLIFAPSRELGGHLLQLGNGPPVAR